MFNKVVELLFPANETNYFYFENSKKTANDLEQQAEAELSRARKKEPLCLTSVEERHQLAFYDFLFGKSSAKLQQDDLSLFIANKVEALLSNPDDILAAIPLLPASVNKLMEQLNNGEFDTQVLVELIEQEPSIAAKVIELANSSYYKRSDKEILDLKSAFMQLGTNGLIEGVINGFIGKLTPPSQVYFKQYGNKIWQHSLTSGVIAKDLIKASAYKSEAAQGYLIGLISNLGDMIIFQILMQAFSYVHPDCQPNSAAFKALMQKKSKQLTYKIAKHWNFPPSILEALALQTKLTQSSMLASAFNKRTTACFVYEANIISELTMMFEQGELTEDELNEAAEELLYSDEAKLNVESIFIKELSN